MTITKIHIKLLSEISDIIQKFCQKFLTWLVFKFFEIVAIFLKFPKNKIITNKKIFKCFKIDYLFKTLPCLFITKF